MSDRYLVIQNGARMHYAVPALLARSNRLQAFYTDLHSEHRWLRWVAQTWPNPPKPLKRLLGRRLPPDLPAHLVRDQPWRTLAGQIVNRLPGGTLNLERSLFKQVIKDDFAGASALYTNFINDDLDLVRKAKDRGLYCVHELIIGADVGRILLEERRRFPDIEPDGATQAEVDTGIERDRLKWEAVDRVLVPSQYCWDSCVALGAKPDKLIQVPYGIQEHWFEISPQTEPGRVLFVGQVGLRKGNHYLAEATRLLQQRQFHGQVRVAGPLLVDPQSSVFAGPTYLGQVPRSLIAEEFRRADVFVLPTLADSFGLVHLEAMACGVPVITTPNCGSVVRDGIDGFIVPIRDAAALADRIEQLVTDRDLRHRMGEAARQRAQHFTWAHYGERLLAALGA